MSKASINVTVNTRPLARAVELTHQRLGEALQTLAEEIVEDAKAVVPVKTGFLRDSISAQPTGDLQIEVEAGADYSGHVEYGTVNQPAQPFLTPAVEKARGRLPDLVAEALNKAFEEASR